jgi:glutamate synthase domain-containing protein 1
VKNRIETNISCQAKQDQKTVIIKQNLGHGFAVAVIRSSRARMQVGSFWLENFIDRGTSLCAGVTGYGAGSRVAVVTWNTA